MTQIEHILVCLDLTDMDDALICYGNYLVKLFNPQKITFLHVMASYDIPSELIQSFPHLDQPIQDVVKEELQEKVNQLFTGHDTTNSIIEVAEGSTTDNIIRYARAKNVTLTLMGKKIGFEGRGGIVRKVLGIIPSSVLLISETTQSDLKHVLVRMDFSKINALALKMALSLKKLFNIKISCHHVYKLPLKYFPQSSPTEDKKLMEQIEKHSQKEFLKFKKKYDYGDVDIPFSVSLEPENDEAHILYRQALAIGADIIFIGSKIKSELADVIVDNTSDKLASTEKNIPVLLVKDRKQNVGFLKFLFD